MSESDMRGSARLIPHVAALMRATFCFDRNQRGHMPPKESSLLALTKMEKGVRFYHKNDERAFFEWLSRILCVKSVNGEGNDGLVVRLKRKPGNDDLRQLLALCHRYGVDMRQLAKFETARNRDWFCDPQSYWYKGVFGKARR
jgi:hypothetical protein